MRRNLRRCSNDSRRSAQVQRQRQCRSQSPIVSASSASSAFLPSEFLKRSRRGDRGDVELGPLNFQLSRRLFCDRRSQSYKDVPLVQESAEGEYEQEASSRDGQLP